MAYRGGHNNTGRSYGGSPNSGDSKNSSQQHQQYAHPRYDRQHSDYSNGYQAYPPSSEYQHNYYQYYDGYNEQNGYYAQQQEQQHYPHHHHKHLQQQQQRSGNDYYKYTSSTSVHNDHLAAKTLQNAFSKSPVQQSPAHSTTNSTLVSSRVNEKQFISAVSTPIVKTYTLGNKLQGNFLSQLSKNSESNDSGVKSFKAVHIKDQDNPKKRATVEFLTGLSKKVEDPRLTNPNGYSKSLNKSFSKTVDKSHKLYLPKFKFDKYSIGEKPSNEIVIWNLHSNTSSLIIKNNFSVYGPILEITMVDDPLTAVPLGMCLLSFDGKVEQAHATALKVVESCNKKLLIQGRSIRCGLNVNNKLYDEIYNKSINARNEKNRKQKLDELKKEENLKLEILRKEKMAREEKLRLSKLNKTQPLASQMNGNSLNSNSISGPKQQRQNVKLSNHDKHILPYSSFNLSYKFQKYIANRPYIFIADKYVSSMHVSSNQLARFLHRYNISRILQQRSGFYLVFNKLNDAMNCFDNVDETKFLSYTIYMTLYVPDDQIDETRVGKLGHVKLAQKQIVNELNAYLLKDLREKVISEMILEVLGTDEMVKLAAEAKKRKDEEELALAEKQKESAKINIEDTVRVVKRIDLNIFKKTIKKPFIPMSHSLNKDDNESDEDAEESASEDEQMEADEMTTAELESKQPRKRKSETISKVTKKKVKIIEKRVSVELKEEEVADEDILSENLNETDEELQFNQSAIITPESENNVELLGEGKDLKIDNVFQPSTKPPGPVFEDHLETFCPTLDFLKLSIKTEEDFKILQDLCKDIHIENPIKDLRFWAWEHLESTKEYRKLKENKEEEIDDVETFDFEDDVLNNKQLRNSSGCFRTEGYHKIPDKLKREYLLHRRKLTNLNPVKNEEDDEANTMTHNNIQSSRVNRANTRRFVADISAQKQIIGETDLLDLNQLTKRKKPVQFARSAIHNWGLYALEPINAGEMIIEYVGERIRQQVAELREKSYLRSGIGSSYLFRVDENTVIDASKKGGIARFINHCCEPSCTAKIIKVGGKKRIVIYALRDVKRNEELTYDYKFERETNDEERIVCLCGAAGCKGYLN
jgi:histone-lysine N-methyltransferase SETD1